MPSDADRELAAQARAQLDLPSIERDGFEAYLRETARLRGRSPVQMAIDSVTHSIIRALGPTFDELAATARGLDEPVPRKVAPLPSLWCEDEPDGIQDLLSSPLPRGLTQR